MTTENLNNEEFAAELADDQLDAVVGGLIHQNAAGRWEVLDDATHSVMQTFDNRMAAIAYAKKKGVSTKQI